MAKQWIEEYHIVQVKNKGYIHRMYPEDGVYKLGMTSKRRKAARFTEPQQLFYATQNVRRQFPGRPYRILLKRTTVTETVSREVKLADVKPVNEQRLHTPNGIRGMKTNKLWDWDSVRA